MLAAGVVQGELDQQEFVDMCKAMKWNTRDTAMSLVFLDTDGDGAPLLLLLLLPRLVLLLLHLCCSCWSCCC